MFYFNILKSIRMDAYSDWAVWISISIIQALFSPSTSLAASEFVVFHNGLQFGVRHYKAI